MATCAHGWLLWPPPCSAQPADWCSHARVSDGLLCAGESDEELQFVDQDLGPEGEDGPERSLASSRWQGRSRKALPAAASGGLSTTEQPGEHR